jgi:hypothetical protein
MPTKPSAAPRVSAAPVRQGSSVAARGPSSAKSPAQSATDKAEPKILFQKFFKSVGPRTYASQVKECANGNHLLVLTEGKRDPQTGEVRKTRVFVYSEDFAAYFRMLNETAQFIRTHPVPEAIKMKRMRHWAKKEADAATLAREGAALKSITPAKVVVATPKANGSKPVPAKPAPRRGGRGR